MVPPVLIYGGLGVLGLAAYRRARSRGWTQGLEARILHEAAEAAKTYGSRRQDLWGYGAQRAAQALQGAAVRIRAPVPTPKPPPGGGPRRPRPRVIDAEFTVVDEDDPV